jgi:hypothetical protein
LLALGASIALLQRATATRMGVGRPRGGDPALSHPSLLEEYLHLRGIDREGRPLERALALLGDELLLDQALALDGESVVATPTHAPARRARGRITFGAGGPLGRELAVHATLEAEFPALLRECIEALALRAPKAAPWLVLDGRMVPQAWRAGQRLEPDDHVEDGDHIDLVIAVGGG